MGADLYLPTVLQDCYARYGRAHQLARETYRLTQGDVQPTLHEETQRLKEALTLHAHHTGEMSPTLFDLVAEIADLAQGEVTVWAMALTEQIAALIPRTEEETTERVGETGPACLAHDLVALLKGHPDTTISHGALWLAQRL